MAQTSLECPKCNAPLAAGQAFCPQCGAALGAQPCRNCGQIVEPGRPFCPKCGLRQGAAPPTRKKGGVLGIIAAVFGGLVVCAVIGSALSKPGQGTPTPTRRAAAVVATQAPTSAPKSTNTPTPTSAPTATPEPAAAVSQLAQKQFGKDLISAELTTITDTMVVASIAYDLGVQWDENSAIRSATLDLCSLAPKLFEIPTITVLELLCHSDFTDVYGNTTKEAAVKFSVSRETAARINWASFDRRNLGRVLVGDYDGVYVHPALRQAWTAFVSQ